MLRVFLVAAWKIEAEIWEALSHGPAEFHPTRLEYFGILGASAIARAQLPRQATDFIACSASARCALVRV